MAPGATRLIWYAKALEAKLARAKNADAASVKSFNERARAKLAASRERRKK